MAKRKQSKRSKPKAKGRDYAAEYKRRMERARVLRIPKSVARGHARKTEYGIREAKRASYLSRHEVRAGQSKLRETGRDIDETTFNKGIAELREMGFSERAIRAIDINDEQGFIKLLLEAGFTPHEAYTLRFSP